MRSDEVMGKIYLLNMAFQDAVKGELGKMVAVLCMAVENKVSDFW